MARQKWIDLYPVVVDGVISFGQPYQRIQPSVLLVQNFYCVSCARLQTEGT